MADYSALSEVTVDPETGLAAPADLEAGIRRQPALFVSHGGGPLPLLLDPQHEELIASWEEYATKLEENRPKAIVVISAHWEGKRDVISVQVRSTIY
jgi:aromatic ring-opening dioxygenase catalytic subunit (LigB family)